MVERWTSEREIGGSISIRALCCVLEQDIYYLPKVLVIPTKRYLRPDMTDKLFTVTLSKTKKKRNENKRT